jgi:peptidoglycan-N-acetylglucosamine deacetylase
VHDLALTFDDGPDATGTPEILDALAAGGGSATFFVIAPRAAAHPELVARIVDEGHAVGLHCDEHVRHSTRDADWGRADAERALERLSGLGVEPTLWRTPWGDTASWTEPLAAELGLRLTGWTVDTHDWRGDRAAWMFAVTRTRLCTGAIVLAHDGIGPGARRDDVRETVAYVQLVVRHAHHRQLQLVPLDDHRAP